MRKRSLHCSQSVSFVFQLFTRVFAAVALLTLFGSAACAVELLAYSFETGTSGSPDGFVPNGGIYIQDTVGATEGTHSLLARASVGETFVGTYSFSVNPTPGGAIIGDPPGVDYVLFDVTISPGEEFTGVFANMGVTVFGMSQAGQFGLQRQFKDEENLELAAGTYTNLRIDLSEAHGTNETFNQAFGEAGSGSPLIPTAFQFFFSKSPDDELIVNIDNVRIGVTPAGVPGDYNGNGTVDAADYVIWRNGGPLQNEVDSTGTVDAADYAAWRARFGNISGSGSGVAAVPEPTGLLLLLTSVMQGLAFRKRV